MIKWTIIFWLSANAASYEKSTVSHHCLWHINACKYKSRDRYTISTLNAESNLFMSRKQMTQRLRFESN